MLTGLSTVKRVSELGFYYYAPNYNNTAIHISDHR